MEQSRCFILESDFSSTTSKLYSQVSSDTGSQLGVTAVRVALWYTPGDLPKDHKVLRKVSSLCHQLPVLDGTAFQKEFHSVCCFSVCGFYSVLLRLLHYSKLMM